MVEDDEDLLEAMLRLLRTAGYGVIGAHNGIEALDRMRGGSVPCVILLDLMLPVMSGWEFRRRQLEDPKLAEVPVIACTAHRGSGEAAALRVEHYLGKPVDLRALLQLIARYCAVEEERDGEEHGRGQGR